MWLRVLINNVKSRIFGVGFSANLIIPVVGHILNLGYECCCPVARALYGLPQAYNGGFNNICLGP